MYNYRIHYCMIVNKWKPSKSDKQDNNKHLVGRYLTSINNASPTSMLPHSLGISSYST